MSRTTPNYAAWRISESMYPAHADPRERLLFLLRYAILAPSAHNTQPWRFRIERAEAILLEPDLERALPHSDPAHRGIAISIGCVLANLLLAAKHFGWDVRYTVEGSSIEELRVRCELAEAKGGNGSEHEAALFSVIPKRYSHKLEFSRRKMEQGVRERLANVSFGRATVSLLTSEEKIRHLAEVHEQATLAFSRNAAFAREVSCWMRRNGTYAGDGMPGFTFGLSSTGALIAKALTRASPATVKAVARKDYKILSGSEVVGLVSSSADTLQGQIEAGAAFQEAALTAAAQGIGFSPKSAIIEADRADRLKELYGAEGIPQIYFGIGYGDGHERHSPRRPLETMLRMEGKD